MSSKGYISRVRSYLQQPQAESFGDKESIRVGILISLAVTVLVYLFNIRYTPLDEWAKIKFSILFGLITFMVVSINDLILPRLAPKWFAEKFWNVGKSIIWVVWNFLSIAIANMVFLVYKGWMSRSIPNFIEILFTTFLIGFIPIIIIKLWEHNRALKARLKEASQINQDIDERTREEATKSNDKITILSNQKEIDIPVDQILFAGSERNYVRFELDNGEEILVRATIKNIEALLLPYPNLLRCHRAFIVNLKKVKTVDGNAQGLRLHLDGHLELVPVSRSYIPKVRAAL